ncbi:MAG: hypothetical protein CK426_09400 [Legionella sp.]|nr:MAG: hypothetical protein CK426_09400 [Legionella sp.]
MKYYVSPYTYRHKFSGIAKAIYQDDDQVAILLGHSNGLSQGYYCNAKKSVGSFKIEQVKGTKQVKHVAQNNLDNILFNSPFLTM